MSKSNHSFEEKVQKTVDEIISKIPNYKLDEVAVYKEDGEHVETVNLEKNPEDFVWDRLRGLGIVKNNEDSYQLIEQGFCKEGDARVVFCETLFPRMPIPWFRKMWSILSPATAYIKTDENTTIGTGIDPNSSSSIIVDVLRENRPVSQMKDIELVEQYATDALPQIIDELAKRAKGKAVVVFNKDKTVNKSLTLQFLRDARRKKIPKTYQKEGIMYTLKNVGDFPNDIDEESPLAPGNILCNGYCDVCEMDFSEVSAETRQFLRLVYNDNKGIVTNRMTLVGLIATAKSGVDALSKVFPSVAVKYEELKELGKLPSLKTNQSNDESTGGSDPFGKNKRY